MQTLSANKVLFKGAETPECSMFLLQEHTNGLKRAHTNSHTFEAVVNRSLVFVELGRGNVPSRVRQRRKFLHESYLTIEKTV